MRKGDKKGELLMGNIIFIVLNLMFLTILFLFITQQGSGLVLLEQSYAKQIALIVDSAKPGMDVFLDFEKGFEKIEESFGRDYDLDRDKIIQVNNNIVTVKLDNDDRRKGYSYSFFNKIDFDISEVRVEGEIVRNMLGFNFK